jgi:hypothetical protein
VITFIFLFDVPPSHDYFPSHSETQVGVTGLGMLQTMGMLVVIRSAPPSLASSAALCNSHDPESCRAICGIIYAFLPRSFARFQTLPVPPDDAFYTGVRSIETAGLTAPPPLDDSGRDFAGAP